MAQFLATTTTLKNFKAQIRSQLGAVSQQESGIIDLEMNDIIHQAITSLRTTLGNIIKDFYITKGTIVSSSDMSGSVPNYTVNIATREIADIHDINLFHSTFGEIPVLPRAKFLLIKSTYSASDIGTTKAIATIANTETALATQSVLTIYVYSNASATSAFNNTEFWYPRYPKKVVADTDTLDLPELYVPLARDIATIYMEKRLSRTPSGDVINSIKATLDPLVSLGITKLNSAA